MRLERLEYVTVAVIIELHADAKPHHYPQMPRKEIMKQIGSLFILRINWGGSILDSPVSNHHHSNIVQMLTSLFTGILLVIPRPRTALSSRSKLSRDRPTYRSAQRQGGGACPQWLLRRYACLPFSVQQVLQDMLTLLKESVNSSHGERLETIVIVLIGVEIILGIMTILVDVLSS